MSGIMAFAMGACTTYTGSGYSARDLASDSRSSKAQNGTYTVRAGDTLYSVAFANNIDMKTLACINNLHKPYNIYRGQVLILDPSRVGVQTYRVQKNDTVYAISRKFGVPIKELVQINDIDSNYTIMVGQLLVVSRKKPVLITRTEPARQAAPGAVSAPAVNPPGKPETGKTDQKPVRPANSVMRPPVPRTDNAPDMTASDSRRKENTRAVEDVRVPTQSRGSVNWKWPAGGRVIEGFSSSEHGNKGIDISGSRGSDIRAASGGKVVYAGNALRGYGNLIIISHNDDFLSAYAHNDSILVREGQQVSRGQVIAKMGDSEAKSVRLHFEIRYRGQTVNPMKYLPAGKK